LHYDELQSSGNQILRMGGELPTSERTATWDR